MTDRIRAGDKKTLRLKKGIVASYKIHIPKKQDYDLIVRYSNDDTGEGDDVLISFKNDFISFHSIDTKEEGGPAGSGWSNFVETEPLHLDLLEEGDEYISFVIIDEDGYGIELDRFTLQPTER